MHSYFKRYGIVSFQMLIRQKSEYCIRNYENFTWHCKQSKQSFFLKLLRKLPIIDGFLLSIQECSIFDMLVYVETRVYSGSFVLISILCDSKQDKGWTVWSIFGEMYIGAYFLYNNLFLANGISSKTEPVSCHYPIFSQVFLCKRRGLQFYCNSFHNPCHYCV